MICSCYFCQKELFFFILGMAQADPLVMNIGPEKATFVEVLPIFFFGTTGLQEKLSILIKSSNIFHWKSTTTTTTTTTNSGCGYRGKIWTKLN